MNNGQSEKRTTPRKVALLIETSPRIWASITPRNCRVFSTSGALVLLYPPGDFEQAIPKMKQWKGDGIVALGRQP